MRNNVQQQWMEGIVHVITATNAFGMGVDKDNVRMIAHWETSSVSNYYQESGRCGRDGIKSFARIYYSRSDSDQAKVLLNMKRNETAVDSLKLMVSYCEGVECRHSLFSSYFGDEVPQCLAMCDSCADKNGVETRLKIFKDHIEKDIDEEDGENTGNIQRVKLEINKDIQNLFRTADE